MLKSIEHRGVFIHECPLPGETRGDDVVPAHPNGIQLSRDRWLILYATRGFEGVDDDRSIVYQLRADTPDGPILRENWLSRCVDDWEPLPGVRCRREHGHPVAFGVPRGAKIGGVVPAQAGIFVAKWRVVGKKLENGRTVHDAELAAQTQGVEWVQFRLNASENDIEIVQPTARLRQKGFEGGPRFCAHKVGWMNQTFVQAVPFNADASEWADCNHFDGWRIAPLKYRFNTATNLYEWVEIGPLLGGESLPFFEASLLSWKNEWLIAARPLKQGPTAWFRARNPFEDPGEPILPAEPVSNAPICAYAGPDGIVRMVTGDPTISPYQNGRDPLYCWELDPDHDFAVSTRHTVFDSVAAGVPIRPESLSRVDMGKILPHPAGKTGYLLHRVRTKSINYPKNTKAIINAVEKNATAIYWAKLHYSEPWPGRWTFEA